MSGGRRTLVRGRRAAGFTLVEVLVSLMLLGLVLAYLPSGYRFVRETWNATARLDREEGQDGAREFVSARLAEALPLFEAAPGQAGRVAFLGGPDRVSFVAPSPNGPAGSGLYRFELVAAPAAGAADAAALVARMRAYTGLAAAPDAAAGTEEHVLIEAADAVTFRYLGRKERLGAAAWTEAWSRSDALPDAVEVIVTSRRRGSPPQRRFFVELRLRST